MAFVSHPSIAAEVLRAHFRHQDTERTLFAVLGLSLALGSTHLESFVGKEVDAVVVAERRVQLAHAGRLLVDEARKRGCVGALLLGDCNWDDKVSGEALSALGPRHSIASAGPGARSATSSARTALSEETPE